MPKRGPGPIAAAELMARLRADPEWMAAEADREAAHRERIAEYERAAEPVKAALRAAGLPTEGFGVFTSRRGESMFGPPPPFEYEHSVPILLEWLPKITDRDVKETIVRSLSTRHARPAAARPLIREFDAADDDTLRWTIGNALEVVADDSVYDEVVRIACERRHGATRQMVVAALGNMANPGAVDVLIELLDCDDVVVHALWGLRKLAAPAARPHVERFADDPRTDVRQEAKKLLKRLDSKSHRRNPPGSSDAPRRLPPG